MSESETDNVWGNLRKHWMESSEREREERNSWASPGMEEIYQLTSELRRYGWRPAQYCPKDESWFLGWDPTSPNPYLCQYHGKWPKGCYWASVDGDLWPARPVLWKKKEDSQEVEALTETKTDREFREYDARYKKVRDSLKVPSDYLETPTDD